MLKGVRLMDRGKKKDFRTTNRKLFKKEEGRGKLGMI